MVAGSAGGVEALIEVLSALPPSLPAPVLVVQHTRTESDNLAEMLARKSGLLVRIAKGGETPRAGEVYLAPHGHHLVLEPDGRLALNDEAPDHHVRPSADRLFASAAARPGAHIVGVVLSGSGSDGAAGVVAVKRAGGVVIVQDQPSSLFKNMPRAAVDTGIADYVLPVRAIGAALVTVTGESKQVKSEIPVGDAEGLLTYLSQSRGFDVTTYKRTTLMRRIQKRMKEVGAETWADYQDRLQVHPEEFAHLFNTILINVTSFFRDPDQWQYLSEQVIPTILGTGSSRQIRIWSAGCATGQEAYTVAMLFAEAVGTAAFRDRVKIYATDVDDDALAQARGASYSAADVKELPADLLEKYFDSSGTRYAFRQDLRRSLIFGRHDLVQDAPISRVDLLLCRNTLMYFSPEIQSRVLARLHYALKDDGFLMLGRAEMLLTHGRLFRPVDMKERVFTRVPSVDVRERFGLLRSMEPEAGPAAAGRQLLEMAGDAAPYAQLVVDEPGHLVAANATARQWFGIVEGDVGRPLQDLEVSFRPIELRSLISRAHMELQNVSVQNVEQRLGDKDTIYLDVAVSPLRDGEKAAGVSILFNDVTRFHELRTELDSSRSDLETAYEELQSTNEELETTNEELQSTIEELETTNEELQSSNEELETMNEELESTNSELQAMNDELRRRTDEIDQVNSFMNSVMSSLELGVIVIDRHLRVQMWNNRSEELWGLRMSEAVGEPLVNLDIGLPVVETLALVKGTLAGDGTPGELAVDAVNRRGRHIRCRVVSSTVTLDGGKGVVLLVEQLQKES